MQLSMSISTGKKPRRGSPSMSKDTGLKLQTPLPLWASASLPEDAEFHLIAPVVQSSCPNEMSCAAAGSLPMKTLYQCPNDENCGKVFASQPELCDHLQPELFTSNSLEPLLVQGYIGARYGPQCLSCSWSFVQPVRKTKSIEKAWAEGIELQKSLTGLSNGMAWCIADFVTRGDLDVELFCHSFGCGPSGKIGDQLSPLDAAAAGGHVKLVEILLRNGADANKGGGAHGTPLRIATSEGHKDIINLLLDHGADVNAVGGYFGCALGQACYEGHDEIIRLLLSRGADPNIPLGGRYQETILQVAAATGREEIVQLLLDNGADINGRGDANDTALFTASYIGHERIVQLLLSNGADPSVIATGRRVKTALHAAAWEGYEKIVEMLLDTGAEIDGQPEGNPTALYNAITANKSGIVELLLTRGADPNIINNRGHETALHAAACNGNEEIVELLLASGADINARCDRGDVLQLATSQGHQAVVEALIAQGADANADVA
ncbi:ankyrin repeat-containing domain protein [Aspergillus crustosus]